VSYKIASVPQPFTVFRDCSKLVRKGRLGNLLMIDFLSGFNVAKKLSSNWEMSWLSFNS